MGAKKTCADNQVIESFHSLLKKGTIHNNIYKSFEEYILDIVKWNEWYIKDKGNLLKLEAIKQIYSTIILLSKKKS
ncbi:hypothetical protein [Spiroplasma endosymbiont of Cantharis nigra]|uniref:hypothetical protein n=1 Tax=Spiroplasma endosymbiont of Cantharis nigra TaxID=3066278 RepID=UPI0030CFDF76